MILTNLKNNTEIKVFKDGVHCSKLCKYRQKLHFSSVMKCELFNKILTPSRFTLKSLRHNYCLQQFKIEKKEIE